MDRESLSDEELELLRTPAPRETVPVFEADRPRVSEPRQDPALVERHAQFAGILGEAIGEEVDGHVQVGLRDEWLGTFSEFVFGQPLPTCCAVIGSQVLDVEFYLTIEPKILFPLFDRMLGTQSTEPVPKRWLTEIEQTLVRHLVSQIIQRYAAMWQQTLSLELSIRHLEHNVQQLSGLRGGDRAHITRYEVAFDAGYGLIEICLPGRMTSMIRQRHSTAS